MLKITARPSKPKTQDFYKYYFKLIGVKFNCKTEKQAKQYFNEIYKSLSLVLTPQCEWYKDDQTVLLQLVPIYDKPEQQFEITHDETVSLVYILEKYKIKDEQEQKKITASLENL